jgi:hypothetical protein
MAIKILPDLEPPPARTKPERRRSDGWFTRMQRRVKLAMSGDDEELLVINNTSIAWHAYHTFHQLGIIDPGETQLFHLQKRGNFSVRPDLESDAAEYLLLDLNAQIYHVEIYRRNIGQAMDVYDLRAA